MTPMITIQKKNSEIVEMSLDEYSRWMCLVEAFFFIEEKAKELKMDVGDLLKPLAIDAYIKERFDSMRHDVGCEFQLGNL